MSLRRLVTVLIVIVSLIYETQAIPIPALDLTELTNSADVIVVGRTTSISEEGTTQIAYNGQSIEARRMLVDLRVARVVKGRLSDKNVPFSFNIPKISLGYAAIPENQYGMFFLKGKADSGYVIVNPYYPFLPASQTASALSGTELERVILETGQVLRAGDTSPQERLNAIKALDSVQGDIVVAALRNGVADNDSNVQAYATASLILHNDLSTLSIAEHLLLNPPPNISSYPFAKLAIALESIKDSQAIPTLSRLLNSERVEVRRGATRALGNIGADGGIAPLARALKDSDLEVRYNAVLGLAKITGQDEWGPSLPLYQQDEKRYLTHWRDWANQK